VINFLTPEDVMGIYDDQMERYGGHAGVHSEELLLSAIAMPQAAFGGSYLHKDIFEMAAAYLFHLVQDHPFIDGNKRTGSMAAIMFLRRNGVEMEVGNGELFEFVLSVARGERDKHEIAHFLRKHVVHRHK